MWVFAVSLIIHAEFCKSEPTVALFLETPTNCSWKKKKKKKQEKKKENCSFFVVFCCFFSKQNCYIHLCLKTEKWYLLLRKHTVKQAAFITHGALRVILIANYLFLYLSITIVMLIIPDGCCYYSILCTFTSRRIYI